MAAANAISAAPPRYGNAIDHCPNVHVPASGPMIRPNAAAVGVTVRPSEER